MADATLTDLLGASGILLRYNAADTAKIWADTGASTPITDGATVKNWQPSSPSTLTAALTEATNGPTYRSNYSSTGYPGVQFDGVNDVLSVVSSGLTTARFHLILVITPLSGGTAMPIGRGSDVNGLAVYFPTSTTCQIFANGSVMNPTIATSGKCVVVLTIGDNQNIIEVAGASHGVAGSSMLLSGTSAKLTLGNLYPTLAGFFAACVIHDVIIVDGTVERGQVIRAAKVQATAWGVSNPNATPQASGGSLNPITSIFGKA